ncbi:MAG: 50S ribosomal protein L4, partial [Phycisphaerae bacterium]|nr:50S ribosomal protein L4 [Phycisphaerae bacterium]
MLEVPVYTTDGKQTDTLTIDESVFGGEVNASLVKQAVVAYHANRRQGTVKTKSRGETAFGTKKMYRQKGTGYARRGDRGANILKGGGHAWAKRPGGFSKRMPRKMRKAALRSAILAKIMGGDIKVVEGLACSEPKTSVMADLLEALEINRSCLLSIAARDRNIHLSSRNIRDLTVRTVEELNAFDVATRQRM